MAEPLTAALIIVKTVFFGTIANIPFLVTIITFPSLDPIYEFLRDTVMLFIYLWLLVYYILDEVE